MANQSVENVKGLVKNKSTRVIVILTFGVVIAGLIVANMTTSNQQSRPKDLQATIDPAVSPTNAKPVPGTSDNPQHNENIKEFNRKAAEEARKTGASVQPILSNSGSGSEKDPFDLMSKKNDGSVKPVDISVPLPATMQKPVQPVVAPVPQQPQQQQVAQSALQKPQSLMQAERDMAQAMAGLLNSWTPSGQKAEITFVNKPMTGSVAAMQQGDVAAGQQMAGMVPQSAAQVEQPIQQKKVSIKAGSILHAVVITSVNSDEPGPVLAQIVTGPYAGGRLIGKFEMTKDDPKLILTFNTLVMQNAERSYQLNSYAIDPGTARSALSSDVDNHYFSRYGMFAAATFLKGYSKAISQSGATQTVGIGAAGLTTATTYPEMDNRKVALAALGEVGSEVAGQLRGGLSRPPTVTLNSGAEIGVLVMQDTTF